MIGRRSPDLSCLPTPSNFVRCDAHALLIRARRFLLLGVACGASTKPDFHCVGLLLLFLYYNQRQCDVRKGGIFGEGGRTLSYWARGTRATLESQREERNSQQSRKSRNFGYMPMDRLRPLLCTRFNCSNSFCPERHYLLLLLKTQFCQPSCTPPYHCVPAFLALYSSTLATQAENTLFLPRLPSRGPRGHRTTMWSPVGFRYCTSC